MYYVYLIKSLKKNWQYVGYTDNLKRRLNEHQLGLSQATKPYRPFELIFYEAYKSMVDAKRREKYFKTNEGKRTLRLMLRESIK